MKTKKLNRGLLLGGVLLVGLAGFVVFDRVSFKSSKGDVEAAVKTYLNDVAAASVSSSEQGKDAYKKAIDDNWGYNKFFDDNFMMSYVTASDYRSVLDGFTDEELNEGSITECTVDLKEIKVSKAGPNLALADVKYVMSFKGKGNAQLLGIDRFYNSLFDSFTFESSESFDYDKDRDKLKDLEYTGKMEFTDYCQFYLEHEGGKWKIVGAQGYPDTFEISDADGKEINVDVLLSGVDPDAQPEEGGDEKQGEEQPSDNSSDPAAMPEAVPSSDDSMPAPDDAYAGNGGEGNA